MSWLGRVAFFCLLVQPALAAEPQRIVALSPVAAEWAAELLGEEVAKKRLIGVSEFSHYPHWVERVRSVGAYSQIQIEEVLRLKPDLVIGLEGSNRSEQLERLKKLSLNLKVLPPESIATMKNWIVELGTALGAEPAAQKLARRWQTEWDLLTPLSPRTVYVQIQSQPLVTIGSSSFIHQALERVGIKTAFSDLNQGYPKVSKEAVLRADPDEIWILDLNGKTSEFEKAKKDWEQFQQLKAVRNQKVRILRGDDFARCSLRLLKALKTLN